MDYILNERYIDNEVLDSSYLFLPTHHLKDKKLKMSPGIINRIWNRVCERAGVKGKTPHSARHHFAMKVLKHPDGTVQAVKEALDHQDPRYSMQYMGVSKNKIRKIVEE